MSDTKLISQKEALETLLGQVTEAARNKLRAGTPATLLRYQLGVQFTMLSDAQLSKAIVKAFRTFGKTDARWRKDRKHHLGLQIECLQYEVLKLVSRIEDLWMSAMSRNDTEAAEKCLSHYNTVLRYRKEIANLLGVNDGPLPKNTGNVIFQGTPTPLGMDVDQLQRIPSRVPNDAITVEFEKLEKQFQEAEEALKGDEDG